MKATLALELADLELAGEAQGLGDIAPAEVVFEA
jgi:hypothetical protein